MKGITEDQIKIIQDCLAKMTQNLNSYYHIENSNKDNVITYNKMI